LTQRLAAIPVDWAELAARLPTFKGTVAELIEP
jgi:hypothetical protein